MNELERREYWRANLKYLALLLALWFAVSFGAGVLLAPWLNQWRLPGTGFKLGFWFAQQGSIYAFVLIIAVYVRLMARLERRMGLREE